MPVAGGSHKWIVPQRSFGILDGAPLACGYTDLALDRSGEVDRLLPRRRRHDPERPRA